MLHKVIPQWLWQGAITCNGWVVNFWTFVLEENASDVMQILGPCIWAISTTVGISYASDGHYVIGIIMFMTSAVGAFITVAHLCIAWCSFSLVMTGLNLPRIASLVAVVLVMLFVKLSIAVLIAGCSIGSITIYFLAKGHQVYKDTYFSLLARG